MVDRTLKSNYYYSLCFIFKSSSLGIICLLMELYLFSKFICYDLSMAGNHFKADHAFFVVFFFFFFVLQL